MQKRFRFSQLTLSELPPAEAGKRYTCHDVKCPWLKVRITHTGAKTLFVGAKIHNNPIRATVCRYYGDDRDAPIGIIRERALAIYQQLQQQKGDLVSRAPTPTFGEYYEIWRKSSTARLHSEVYLGHKDQAVRDYCKPIRSVKIDKISRAMVRKLLDDLVAAGKNRTASLTRTIIKQVLELAVDDGRYPEDRRLPLPQLNIKKGKRNRTLSGEELKRLLQAASNYAEQQREGTVPIQLIILLAFLTAQRRGNILSMR